MLVSFVLVFIFQYPLIFISSILIGITLIAIKYPVFGVILLIIVVIIIIDGIRKNRENKKSYNIRISNEESSQKRLNKVIKEFSDIDKKEITKDLSEKFGIYDYKIIEFIHFLKTDFKKDFSDYCKSDDIFYEFSEPKNYLKWFQSFHDRKKPSYIPDYIRNFYGNNIDELFNSFDIYPDHIYSGNKNKDVLFINLIIGNREKLFKTKSCYEIGSSDFIELSTCILKFLSKKLKSLQYVNKKSKIIILRILSFNEFSDKYGETKVEVDKMLTISLKDVHKISNQFSEDKLPLIARIQFITQYPSDIDLEWSTLLTPGIYKKSRRKKINKDLISDLLEESSYSCQVCGAKKDNGATLEIDHIIPLAKGGDNEYENLQVLCATCNRKKGSNLNIDYIG